MRKRTCELYYYLKFIIYSGQGLGLVELLIALALLSIVLSLGYTFLFFGASAFRTGEQQADIQQNARLAAGFITRELRIAERVVLVDGYTDLESLDIEAEGEFYLNFIYNHDGNIYFQVADESGVSEAVQDAVIQDAIAGNINFDLNFRLSGAGNILQFDLTAEEMASGRSYTLETEVLVLNLDQIEDHSSGSGKAIFYQAPAPPNPAIRDIRLEPHSHIYDGVTTNTTNLTVYTSNVADGSTLAAEFLKIDEDGSEVNVGIPSQTVSIVNNRVDLIFTLPSGLYFGDYFVSVDVEGVNSVQRRFYYIYPVIDNISITDIPGQPQFNIIVNTSGVPEGTAAEITLVDWNNQENEIAFEFHSGNNIVDEKGTIDSVIKIDPDDEQKLPLLFVTIGKVTENSEPFEVED